MLELIGHKLTQNNAAVVRLQQWFGSIDGLALTSQVVRRPGISTLQPQSTSGFQIFVKNFSVKSTVYEVEKFHDVGDLKAKIQKREGYPYAPREVPQPTPQCRTYTACSDISTIRLSL